MLSREINNFRQLSIGSAQNWRIRPCGMDGRYSFVRHCWRCCRGRAEYSRKGSADAVPPNGQARPYGRGWVCKPGFRQDGSACVAVKLPENGYLSDTSYGAGWECRYGYRQDGNLCTAVNLPRNAYLTELLSGEYWECERGYRKAEKGCVADQRTQEWIFVGIVCRGEAGSANAAFVRSAIHALP